MYEIPDLSSDDAEAGAPEVCALDVDAEAVGEGDGVSEAGEGEEPVINRSKAAEVRR
jgi:hypothetical protein